MQRNSVALRRDDEECSLTEGGNDCLCDECGKPFQKLRHLCRFEKGGYCKETRKSCGPQNCPQIRK